MLAILIALAIFAFGLAPLAFAYWKSKAAAPVALLYGAAIAGLAVYHSGTSIGEVPQSVKPVQQNPAFAAPSEELDDQCAQAIALAEQGGVITDRSDPANVVVAEGLWKQLPDMARQAFAACLERDASGEVEIVLQ